MWALPQQTTEDLSLGTEGLPSSQSVTTQASREPVRNTAPPHAYRTPLAFKPGARVICTFAHQKVPISTTKNCLHWFQSIFVLVRKMVIGWSLPDTTFYGIFKLFVRKLINSLLNHNCGKKARLRLEKPEFAVLHLVVTLWYNLGQAINFVEFLSFYFFITIPLICKSRVFY